VLVAGGGTGDATVMLAQQLADAGGPAEIVHVDLSDASLGLAEARVRARGLTNVTFNRMSLLDLREPASVPSTTSTAAACFTTWTIRRPASPPWSRCWPSAAASG
jgi:cyclopropane fatty-acyl-phospholipid synthase-like methyltransferase